MSLVTRLPKTYADALPALGRFIRMSAAATQVQAGSPRQPDPPRSLQQQPGSLKSRVTWIPPANSNGVVGYRVYSPNESTPVQASRDPKSLFCDVPLSGASSTLVFISSYNAQGVESAKIPIIVKSNTDQLVTSGTSGGTNGYNPNPPPQWPYHS